jgi:ribonuclease-3
MNNTLSSLEESLGVTFKDKNLLQTALVHRSYLNENRGFHLPHNERLEFLGDAVLELVVTEHLYRNYPNPEGELTNLRAALVNYKMLAEIANRLGVEPHLLLSRGEAKDTGRARQVILANALEALIGAIYLDQGMEIAKVFIEREVLKQLPAIIQNGAYLDPKSKLQELVQDKLAITPMYKVLSESGPDHAKVFEVGVFIGETLLGKGSGPSKQDAEVLAAQHALEMRSWEN